VSFKILAGEWKSSKEENTLALEKVVEQTESTSMVDASKPSAKREKKNTGIDASQALEILATVIGSCRNAGITVQVVPFFDQGHTSTIVQLVDVQLVDGRLIRG
jgi:hypothetical protein